MGRDGTCVPMQVRFRFEGVSGTIPWCMDHVHHDANSTCRRAEMFRKCGEGLHNVHIVFQEKFE